LTGGLKVVVLADSHLEKITSIMNLDIGNFEKLYEVLTFVHTKNRVLRLE